VPPHIQAILERRGELPVDPTLTWAPTEDQFRHALAAEFGSLSFIDQSIGRVLDAVDRLGLRDTTTIVFTSDHGDMFGDHGLMLKHFVHYDATTRIPLIVQSPDGEHQRVESLVSSADLAPTVLDLAGVKPYLGIQGHSLRPLLEHTAHTLRERVLIEEDQPFGIPGLPGPVRIRTLVTEDARLSVYANRDFGELYDHSLDPQETTNLYGEAEADFLKANLTAQMAQELIRLDDMGTAPIASA
jgi:arylsulfatase A-like enzyme